MAKPKFELTSDLIKIEPEPDINSSYQKNNKEQLSQKESPEEPALLTAVPSRTVDSLIEQREEIREAISMKISKDLKKDFHLWCVRRGITMTDAIEAAIRKYLQE